MPNNYSLSQGPYLGAMGLDGPDNPHRSFAGAGTVNGGLVSFRALIVVPAYVLTNFNSLESFASGIPCLVVSRAFRLLVRMEFHPHRPVTPEETPPVAFGPRWLKATKVVQPLFGALPVLVESGCVFFASRSFPVEQINNSLSSSRTIWLLLTYYSHRHLSFRIGLL